MRATKPWYASDATARFPPQASLHWAPHQPDVVRPQVFNSLPPMERADASAEDFDYPAEVAALEARMAMVATLEQVLEVRFFDSKLNVALAIIGTLLLGYGQSVEAIMLHSFGETTAVYESGTPAMRARRTSICVCV